MNILMVCLGNICRSPLAEGIMREKLIKYGISGFVDSAGTSAFHTGENPDFRSIEIALKHGIDISEQRARLFSSDDFDKFDYIFVMDRSNYSDVLKMAQTNEHRQKIELIMNSVEPGKNLEVPDPFYGGKDEFAKVYNLLNNSCEVIARSLTK
ncbi:MAG TPA: low molecular weight protein-tyrosine-phosphatase [Bacteroidales bacterium]|nr:low molecular weight protein-tyrosine-phosphatase [Bacteroidales bacterium]